MERVIFNNVVIKLWFRYRSDISVLDATIAHLFQGSPRPNFEGAADYPSDKRGLVVPTFKLSSRYFNQRRPRHLQFSKLQGACELHRPGKNELGLACPCRYGNIDIVMLLAFVCRQFGTKKRDYFRHDTTRKLHWNYTRDIPTAYDRFQKQLLWGHELYPLLEFLKNAPFRFSSGDPDLKTEFYQSMKPGMEDDDDKMGYNIGDVVGIALIMRFLTTTDNRGLYA